MAAELAAAEAEIDAEMAEVVTPSGRHRRRASTPTLLERYEQLRHDLGGIAVARLVGTNCGGCHLTLSAVELDRIRHQPTTRWCCARSAGACSCADMLLWYLGVSVAFVWNVFRSPALDYRLVMLGSVLPTGRGGARRARACCTPLLFTVVLLGVVMSRPPASAGCCAAGSSACRSA